MTIPVIPGAEICHFLLLVQAKLFIRRLYKVAVWLQQCFCREGSTQSGRRGFMKNNKKNGFSLLELLIVVAIILLIATIAIPSLLRSRQAANESHAVANLRTLNTAEVQYVSSYQTYGALPELVTAGLLDARYTSGSAGYNFDVGL